MLRSQSDICMPYLLHNTQHLSRGVFQTATLPSPGNNEKITGMEKDVIKNNIRPLRESLGLSQEEFGKKINASRHDVSRYEAGKHLTVRLLLDIKRVFGVSLDYLLDYGVKNTPGKTFKIDNDLMQRSHDAVVAAATRNGIKLDKDNFVKCTSELYNLVADYRSKGQQLDPTEPMAFLILKAAS